MNAKADYVRQHIEHDGKHTCHWPNCGKAVPPAMWGCKAHWFRLPLRIRNRIWATYRPGQEVSKTPSLAYIETVKEALAWIATTNQPAGDSHE